MYRCDRCGSVFEEPRRVADDPSPAGVSLTSGYYYYDVCPICGEDMLTEVEECPVCVEYKEVGEPLCDECKVKVFEALDGIAETFHLDEYDFNDIFEKYLNR